MTKIWYQQVTIISCLIAPTRQWYPTQAHVRFSTLPFSITHRITRSQLRCVDFDSLMDMDVVVYSRKDKTNDVKEIGAVQEDGTVAPLSVWSTEPVYGNSLEFVVDEQDRFPGLDADDVVIHNLIPENKLSYGSRQVGGGKGPGNPHGEESELLYYVENDALEEVQIVLKPELEITW